MELNMNNKQTTPSKRRTDIQRIEILKGKRGDFSPLQKDHYHNFFEIFYLYSGECFFLLKDSVYQMKRGDLVFIAPGELHHALYEEGSSCEIVNILFKKEYLPVNNYPELHSFMGSVPALYLEDFHALLNKMLSESSRIDEYSDSKTERGKNLRKTICEKFKFASLEFQSIEGIIKSIGLEPCKLCTYCWTGKE